MAAHVQVDNPQRGAIFPVGFLAPAPVSALGFGMLPESGLPSASAAKAPAICARVAVWRRMPAGVLCYERLEVCDLAPALTLKHHMRCCCRYYLWALSSRGLSLRPMLSQRR